MKINATRIGLITAAVMILASLFFYYVLKLPVNSNSQFIVWAIYVAGVIVSLLYFQKNSDEPKTLKNYFSQAFKCFIVITLLMAIYTFIFYKLNPQILETALTENNKLILAEGNRTPMEIAENEKKLRDIYIPMMLAVHTVKNLILGALTGIIGAAFLSNK
jgi:cobalamin synthase